MMKIRREDAEQAYEELHPADKLIRKLQAFFKRVDPSREALAEPLAKEALSRADGMYRLNEKLMDKYGATITLDI